MAEAPETPLAEQLDLYHTHKAFRNPAWRTNPRRNKNVKTILGDASRLAASSSVAPGTPQDGGSGSATPSASASGVSTPTAGDLARASQSLSKLVLEKSLRAAVAGGTTNGSTNTAAAAAGANGDGSPASGPGAASRNGIASLAGGAAATYTNIESAPSLAHAKRYCDITGLPAPYIDPKSRLRYHNREVFALIRNLPPGVAEQYLEIRGAHTILK